MSICAHTSTSRHLSARRTHRGRFHCRPPLILPVDARNCPYGCPADCGSGVPFLLSYVGALIESDFEIAASYTTRNSPIYQHDSDFEVFIDAGGFCHQYKELELNALNTVWNLLLDKPYSDGGGEFSGRVASKGEPRYYDVRAQRTATRLVRGGLNASGGGVWAVEIAMAHSDTLRLEPSLPSLPRVAAPAPDTLWRINFSRVEHKGDINWVWNPMRIWDARQRTFAGKVNMHLPDAWGYVQLVPSAGAPLVHDVHWPARLAAASLYYAQHEYWEVHGIFASEIRQLEELLPLEITDPFAVDIVLPQEGQFRIQVEEAEGDTVVITQDRLMLVRPASAQPSQTNAAE